MTRYVLGFLFARNGNLVLLIHKARGPANVVGRLNGIGGKVHPDETTYDAMRREAEEEAGVDVIWHRYGSMGGPAWDCDLFYSYESAAPKTMDETEPVAWHATKRINEPGDIPAVDNVAALIAMAVLHHGSDDTMVFRMEYLP